MGSRSAPRFHVYVDWVRRTIARLNADVTVMPYLEVFDMVASFRDCQKDGSHLTYGVPEAVVYNKIIPWLCPPSTGF